MRILTTLAALLLLAMPALAADPPALAEAKAPLPPITVHFSPNGGCTETAVAAIASAKKEVLVQAYSFTSAPIADALIAAHKAGVEVKIVLDKGQLSAKGSEGQRCHKAGIETTYDHKHAIAHNKILIIDGTTFTSGSFNFTAAAELHNAENFLVIHDKELAQVYRKNWLAHRAHSIPAGAKAEGIAAPEFPDEAVTADPPAPVPVVPPGPITLKLSPPTLSVAVGEPIIVRADSAARKITWRIPAEVTHDLNDAGHKACLWAAPGTYTLTASVPDGDDVISVDFILTVTGPRPPPIPPPPPDGFAAALQEAYTADTGTDKLDSLKFLRNAYRGMATNPKATLATNGEALAWIKSVIEVPAIGLTPTQIVGVRKVIGSELGKLVGGTAATKLDAAKFAAALGLIADKLAEVK